jgi:DNA-binding NarL/FixJ family response regulator
MHGMPVIMLTDHAEEATVIAASKFRINGYLVKPVSPKQLSDQLRNVLATRKVIPTAQGSREPA